MFEREVALYRALRPHLRSITFVTYGDQRDLAYANRIPGIRILCNRWGLSDRWYTRLLTTIYPLLWRGPTVLKSNQVWGADVPLRIASRFNRKFVARCGYLYSEFVERQHGVDSPQAGRARTYEGIVFAGADRVVVTAPAMRQAVIERYSLPEEKVTVIPNYVDAGLFKPNPNGSPRQGRICFIGRLEEQKNPFALLEAVKGLDVELLMIGNGSLRGALEAKAQAEGLPVRFLGNLPHTALPEYLSSSQLFVLPSFYEGHPKTLIEAMACGLPVIGADVPGVRELIRHRETGYLCGTSPEEIRAAIQEVLGDPGLQARIGRNAREFVVEHFALERVAQQELELLSAVVAK